MGKDLDLLHAVKNNDVGTVRKILSKVWSAKSKKAAKKFNINIQDEDGFTALHHAALNGNTDITMALLDVQCNVNARDKKGMAPMHLASWAGKTEITKLLVDARACVNICADSGDTPLHLACQHCNIGVVEVLLDSNVDSTVVNKNGESALDLACRFGHAQVVEMLLKSKDCRKLLSLYEQNPKTADPPMHIACKTGREEIVIMLLDHGANINQKGANGTPLHEASLFGKTDVVKILLDSGADVNIPNDEGHVPLDLVLRFTSSRASQEIKDLLRDASKAKVVTAKAIHDYQNIYDPTYLSFKTGDVIEILEQNESGRWKGKVTVGKRELVGYFPSTMVKVMNTRKSVVSGKTLSMKNAGILPVGKYEVVALPSASGQSSPLNGRPRLSSFHQNGRSIPSPPVSPENEQYQPIPAKKNRPNPLTNGLEESTLFNKNKESLQYVEVSVDNNSPPPTSPSSSNGPRTQYAEVVLHSPVNGATEDEEPPSLPQKSYKQENVNEKRMDKEREDGIWVKNWSDDPELLVKPNSVRTSTEMEMNICLDGNEMKDEMKNKNGPENEEDLLLTHDTSSELEKVIQSLDANRPSTPEKPRKTYEDMSLDSPDRETLPERKIQFSPKKLDYDQREPRGSPSTERRQILAYENVELNKHRPKDAVVTTMLITDIDQEMDPDYRFLNKGVSPVPPDTAPDKKHRYENVRQGFESSERTEKEGVPKYYEEMSTEEDESKNYEDMAGVGVIGKLSKGFETTPGYVLMQGEKKTLFKTDSYENIDIKPQEGSAGSSGSADYMSMKNGVYTGPNRDYINIQLPAAPDSVDPSLPDVPSGITMSDYNCLYDWLESCKLVIYIDNFVQGGFDMSCMAGLTAEDLTAINVTKTGHRKKLLSESSKLQSDAFPHERPEDIMMWLRLIHLDQYIPQFIDNGFDDMDFVQDITIEDIVSIGITKPGHQRKIWMAVKALGLAGPDENTQGTHNKVTGIGNAEGYLETDLDMVEQDRMKEREGMEVMNTDIDSALSRLPADGASDVAVAFEDTSAEHEDSDETREDTPTKTLDREMASLQIDSLDDTRGSTPNLDSILDSLDKDSTEKKKASPPSHSNEKRSSGPFQMSLSRRSRSSSKDRLSGDSATRSSNSMENQLDISSSEIKDTKSSSKPAEGDFGKTAGGVRQDNSLNSKEPNFTKSRPRHKSMDQSHVTVSESSSFDQRMRGTSFDSKTAKKRPPPPVKPKTPKKPPPPVAPKPTGSPVKVMKDSGTTDTQNTERRLYSSAGSSPRKMPPPTLPKTRAGSVRSCSSTGSEDAIEAALEDLEKRKHYDRRKSFEKLKQRFTDPSSENSGYEDGNNDFTMTCESQPGLQEQRRRSQENILVGQDQPKALKQDTTITTTTTTTTNDNNNTTSKDDVDTDEELLKDQQYTEDLMKDINSMLSDFSTEIETMFDDQPDKSTSV